MRALDDISSATDDLVLRARLLDRGKRVIDGCADRVQDFDLARLRTRFARLESRYMPAPPDAARPENDREHS